MITQCSGMVVQYAERQSSGYEEECKQMESRRFH
jgi:hypothetical protein